MGVQRGSGGGPLYDVGNPVTWSIRTWVLPSVHPVPTATGVQRRSRRGCGTEVVRKGSLPSGAQDTVTAYSNASGAGVRRLAGGLNTFAVLNRGVRR
jgi:hypothetical protein